MTKKAFDSSKFLQNAVFVLHELQKQASDLKDETNDEITKVVKKFKGSCEDLSAVASIISSEAKRKAKAGVGNLPERWANEVDRFLDRVGLERKGKSAPAKTATKKTAAPRKTSVKAKAKPKAPRKPKTPKATEPS